MQRALERARIDLVVLDVNLGEDDGLRLCRSLRAGGDLPFIIVARRADEVDRILGLEMGADDYLAKPVNSRELLARMRNILRRVKAAARPPPAAAPACFALAAGSSTAWRASCAIRTGQRANLRNWNIACSRRCWRTATAWFRAANSSNSRAAATPVRSIAASTCASAGCGRSSATMRACRASSRQYTVKVMSSVSPLNAPDRCAGATG